MRWGVEKRLEFIEFRLFWEGGINRSDITEKFGVSVPQASKDLNLYEEKAPGNLIYDKSAKRYLTSPRFKPVFLVPEAVAYLNQLRVGDSGAQLSQDTWLAFTPEADSMPVPHRRIEPAVLRSIVAAIRDTQSIEVQYQSMNANRELPEWRRITPHAFGDDGLRWHVRAFCHIDRKFKDFVLSRCLDVRACGQPGADPHADTHWRESFEVLLAPNPVLSEAQRGVIAQDYVMEGGKASVPVRKALLYYFQKRLRLDVADFADDPHETPVIVANRAAFNAALAEAMR